MNRIDDALAILTEALIRAEEKHPGWPDDLLHGIAIITEEIGEASQEAIEWTYREPDEKFARILHLARLANELAQTGAVVLRMLVQVLDMLDQAKMEDLYPRSGAGVHRPRPKKHEYEPTKWPIEELVFKAPDLIGDYLAREAMKR